jgi:hypothetical protein
MECAECARLGARRELLETRYAKTLALLSASVVGGIVADFLDNRSAADEAKVDLDRATAELHGHQKRHRGALGSESFASER